MTHDGWGHPVLGKTQEEHSLGQRRSPHQPASDSEEEACDISNMCAKTLSCCFRKPESLKNILEASASEP